MASRKENFLLGIYDDDEKVLHAVEHIRHQGVEIADVFTPFPVHGLDKALGMKRTRLPRAAFLFGLTGTILALTMQTYMMTIDWPMDIGGKPYFPFPAFIPVTFELTVLIASLGMVATYLIVSGLTPGKVPELADIRQTDDLFVIAINPKGNETLGEKVRQLYKETHAMEVREKEMTAKDS
jgi:hypothetical protein